MRKTLTALVAAAAVTSFAGQALACTYGKVAQTKKPTVTAQADQSVLPLPQTPKTTTKTN